MRPRKSEPVIALGDDRLVRIHLAAADQHSHHVRGSSAARRAVEGPIGEDVDVLVLSTRCTARPIYRHEIDRADVRQGRVLDRNLPVDRMPNGEPGLDQLRDPLGRDLDAEIDAAHRTEEVATEGDIDRNGAVFRRLNLKAATKKECSCVFPYNMTCPYSSGGGWSDC